MMRQLFLPAGLILAVGAGLVLPGPGRSLHRLDLIPWLVVLIFLISGYRAGPGALAPGSRPRLTLTAAVFVSLLLAPALGAGLARLLHLGPAAATGLLVMAAVPPTLSSGVVITGISGGNVGLALLLTLALNLTGIFTLPPVLGLTLATATPVVLDQQALLLKMILLVLVPFLLGRGARKARPPAGGSPAWGYLTSTCVILVVYLSFSHSRDRFFAPGESYLVMIAAALLLHLLLLACSGTAALLLGLTVPDGKALVFVCSQKTLPLALAVLASLGADTLAPVICLLLHFIQLIIDSILGARWPVRAEKTG